MSSSYGMGGGAVGAGIPFMEGAVLNAATQVEVDFPRVTRSVTVINKAAAALRVYFADTTDVTYGANVFGNHHYITLDNDNDSITMHVRCRSVYIYNEGLAAGAYEVFAEITAAKDEMNFDAGYVDDKEVQQPIPGIND